MGVILSKGQIDRGLEQLEIIEKNLIQFQQSCNQFVNELKKNPTVQSFYESGEYGQSMEEKMIRYQRIVADFSDKIMGNNGLVPASKRILENQYQLLSKQAGSTGGNLNA